MTSLATCLYRAYSQEGRNPEVEPKLMFKILVYAYSQGVYSSRKIETATDDLEKAVKQLTEIIREQAIPLIYGRGHRKSQIQKDKECLENCLERQKRYDIHKKNFRGRNSYSKTDPDATFMHMTDDHMCNAQLKPGYNSARCKGRNQTGARIY